MNSRRKISNLSGAFAAVVFLALSLHANAQTPALASWNDGRAKQAIVSFVKEVTDESGTKYVESQDRIATVDQDGTLWVEHPLHTQAMFALARVHQLAPNIPNGNNAIRSRRFSRTIVPRWPSSRSRTGKLSSQ
jgi:hypothetical protein